MPIAICDGSTIVAIAENGTQVFLPDGRSVAGPVATPLSVPGDPGYVIRSIAPRPAGRFEQAADDTLTIAGDVVVVGSATVPRDAAVCRSDLQAEIVRLFERKAVALVQDEYGLAERDTWSTQRAEAEAWTADNGAATPFLDGCRRTGEAKADQVATVLAKAAAFESAVAPLLAHKRDLIAGLAALSSVADFEAYADTIAAGWPE